MILCDDDIYRAATYTDECSDEDSGVMSRTLRSTAGDPLCHNIILTVRANIRAK